MEISIISTMVEFVATAAELSSDVPTKIQKNQILAAEKIEEEIVAWTQIKIMLNAESMLRQEDNANYVDINAA